MGKKNNIQDESSSIIDEINGQLEDILQKKREEIKRDLEKRIKKEESEARRKIESIEKDLSTERKTLAQYKTALSEIEKSKEDIEIHDLVKYLVNWVAGTKLIFILLLFLILMTADEQTLIYSSAVLAGTISVFFWRLFPLIRKMDLNGQIIPNNYSFFLGGMILVFVLGFIIVFLVSI